MPEVLGSNPTHGIFYFFLHFFYNFLMILPLCSFFDFYFSIFIYLFFIYLFHFLFPFSFIYSHIDKNTINAPCIGHKTLSKRFYNFLYSFTLAYSFTL